MTDYANPIQFATHRLVLSLGEFGLEMMHGKYGWPIDSKAGWWKKFWAKRNRPLLDKDALGEYATSYRLLEKALGRTVELFEQLRQEIETHLTAIREKPELARDGCVEKDFRLMSVPERLRHLVELAAKVKAAEAALAEQAERGNLLQEKIRENMEFNQRNLAAIEAILCNETPACEDSEPQPESPPSNWLNESEKKMLVQPTGLKLNRRPLSLTKPG